MEHLTIDFYQIKHQDKQIEAEKKRDGKSAASVAKITAVEKKKDAIARKAFNTNKKLQMAIQIKHRSPRKT